MLDTLRKLTQYVAPSGGEANIAEYIASEIRPYVDEITTDPLGNVIAHKKGTGKKLLFAAHMDEIGVIATFIEENGFIRFAALGGVSPYTALCQRVVFQNGTVGIIAAGSKAEMKELKLSDLFIDIGAADKAAAEQLVSIGDSAGFAGDFCVMGDCVASRCLDNRAGCAVLLETARRMGDVAADLYYVFTVQEELGLRGAKTTAFGVSPDYGIAIDVTRTGDTPDSKAMVVSVGKGPAIKVRDSSMLAHPAVKTAMVEAAKRAGIPYQMEVLEQGGTDAGAIHLSGGGVPSGCISIPTRYIHSPAEVASIADMENCVRLSLKLVQSIE